MAHLGDDSLSLWAYELLLIIPTTPPSLSLAGFDLPSALPRSARSVFSARGSGPTGPSRQAISDCNQRPAYVSHLLRLRVFPPMCSQGCNCRFLPEIMKIRTIIAIITISNNLARHLLIVFCASEAEGPKMQSPRCSIFLLKKKKIREFFVNFGLL